MPGRPSWAPDTARQHLTTLLLSAAQGDVSVRLRVPGSASKDGCISRAGTLHNQMATVNIKPSLEEEEEEYE